MKLRFTTRTIAFPALLLLMPLGAMHAQSADPAPSVAPSNPVVDSATPAPTAAASPSPIQAEPSVAKPQKPQRSAAEKAARKADRLKKYDTNKDGKLDEKERASMRADKAKASPTP